MFQCYETPILDPQKNIRSKIWHFSAQFGLRRPVSRDCVRHHAVPTNRGGFRVDRNPRNSAGLVRRSVVANRIPTVLPHSAPEITRQSQPAKFRFPDHEMERPEPRVRLCQIERGGGKLVAEGDGRAVAEIFATVNAQHCRSIVRPNATIVVASGRMFSERARHSRATRLASTSVAGPIRCERRSRWPSSGRREPRQDIRSPGSCGWWRRRREPACPGLIADLEKLPGGCAHGRTAGWFPCLPERAEPLSVARAGCRRRQPPREIWTCRPRARGTLRSDARLRARAIPPVRG